jgi:hypothetical protein
LQNSTPSSWEKKILEFFMAPTVKTHLSVLAQRFQSLNLERKVWMIEKFWKHIRIQCPKYIRNRHFSSWDKMFVDQCNVWHRVFEKYAPFAEATFIKEKEQSVRAKTWVRPSYLNNK